MSDPVEREESLRDALFSLEEARAQERSLREEYAGLLRAMGVLSAPASREALFHELVQHVRVALRAEQAHLLELDPSGEWMIVTASTLQGAAGVRLRLGGVLSRALQPPPRVVFDTEHLPQWGISEWTPLGAPRSLLVSNLGHPGPPLVLLGAHASIGAFHARQGQVVTTLSPLVRQALRHLDDRELRQQQWLTAQKAALLEHATDAMGIGLFCMDSSGHLTYSSPTFERLVEAWASPRAWLELICARLDAADALEPSRLVEVEVETPAAHRKHFELHWIGEAEFVPESQIVLVEDVTARRQADAALERSQEQLRQATKMEAIGRLAGGVAHDFNNLLNVVLSSAEAALGTLPPERLERRFLEEIVATAQHGATLTRQLLSFSRHRLTQNRPLVLNAVVHGLAEMLVRVLRQDIELELELCPELGYARVKAGQLEQILINLAINARDAMPGPGRIRIATANLDVLPERMSLFPQTPPGSYVTLSVSDHGCGIDRQALPHLFEPFFTTKEASGGTGMGLAIVYGIVRQSGGSIEVESQLGSGATFRICLPRVDGEPDSPASSRVPSEPRTGTGSILLVEDNQALCAHIARHLLGAGYDVICAHSGQEALALVAGRERQFDLLVTDVVMPRMRGDHLARELRVAHPELKVVLMSGYASGAGEERHPGGERAEFLQKPFAADELLRVVAKVSRQ